MNKTLTMDFSPKRLIATASKMVDEHNYIGALKLLNKNAELNGNNEDSYMLYAEIFDDLQIFEKSVNYWYKFIDVAEDLDISDAYEGLAVCYMNTGNEQYGAYYYNKLLNASNEIPPESREMLLKSFLKEDRSPLRIIYPPKLCDYTKEISDGIDFMRECDFESAIKSFDKVDEQSDKYLSARNYIAMCKIITDKSDEAEVECNSILARSPNDIQALTTLAAVKSEQKKFEESKEIARRLLAINAKNTDEIYKIATVCCENKMHEEAYLLFKKLEKEIGNDCTVLYFTAISAYNSGKIEESLKAFEKLLVIYPNAVTARYFLRLVKENPQNWNKEPLSYFYRLPEKQKLENIKFLTLICSLPKKDVNIIKEELNAEEVITWAFDEGDAREESELQYLALAGAIRLEYDEFVRGVLLNAYSSDGLKVHALCELASRNENNIFGVVVYHTYKTVTTQKLKIGRAKRSKFIDSYAHLFARFAVISDRYGYKIARATQEVYKALEEREALSLALDVKSLTAAIYLKSGINEMGITVKNSYEFFGGNKQTVEQIIQLINL